jgi:hypothetical protein
VARIKRPIPKRDRPIRSWASAVGAEAPEAASGARKDGGGDTRRVNGDDPVVRGVVMGGRVVDEWIRQAQQAARLMNGTPGNAGWADASGRMFRAASDFMAAWLTTMSAPMANGSATWPGWPSSARPAESPSPHAPTSPPPPDFAAAASSPSDGAAHVVTGSRVKVEVASRRPVDVTIDLHTRSAATFRVLDLRPELGDAPRIQRPEFESWNGDGLRLRLTVPDDQPSGSYHAVILDDDGDCAVGTVTLRIHD